MPAPPYFLLLQIWNLGLGLQVKGLSPIRSPIRSSEVILALRLLC